MSTVAINTTGTVWPSTDVALLITDWALHPSAYPSVMQSVVFDGALHVLSRMHVYTDSVNNNNNNNDRLTAFDPGQPG